ncbi:hypothetical protein pb186bvf_009228 [Paramecium bursaria]
MIIIYFCHFHANIKSNILLSKEQLFVISLTIQNLGCKKELIFVIFRSVSYPMRVKFCHFSISYNSQKTVEYFFVIIIEQNVYTMRKLSHENLILSFLFSCIGPNFAMPFNSGIFFCQNECKLILSFYQQLQWIELHLIYTESKMTKFNSMFNRK